MAQSKIAMVKLNNGVEMPIFGLGTYKATGSDIKQAVKDAIELGYRHFDTADYYKVCLLSPSLVPKVVII